MTKEIKRPDPVENRKQVYALIRTAYTLLGEITLRNQILSEEAETQLFTVCKALSDGEKTTKCLLAQVKHDCWFKYNSASKESAENYALRTLIIAALLDATDSENRYSSEIFAVLRHDLEHVSLDILPDKAREFALQIISKIQPFEAFALLTV
ncbi:MAG: hypothetical protein H6773_00865 [Pseudomonadales bacterium]|nr:hypothetical protein [Candidatus Woesebacteria bacterium]MCB9800708.1 hypothetical protein [Pseudomonadales bacterium]